MDVNVRIDKGVPIPPLLPQRFPFHLMEIGDSFYVPGRALKGNSLYRGAARQGIRVTCRKVAGGIRCWRTQ